ncbi:MAG: cardiolipin synthase [Culicoidibacterales bacterium]
MKKTINSLFTKAIVIYVGLIIQIALILVFVFIFSNYRIYYYLICLLISIMAVGIIIHDKSGPEFKIPLIIVILLFPMMGGVLYMFFGIRSYKNKEWKRMIEVQQNRKGIMHQNEAIFQKLTESNRVAMRQSKYIYDFDASPVYQNTELTYLSLGEIKHQHMLIELQKAKKYIFMEYFIIAEGKMWDSILAILVQKLAEGVDIRVIYDGFGVHGILEANYHQKLEKLGIKCFVFNPLTMKLSLKTNSRDHRKICVIDGLVGFTGGINLGDEYINAYQKHGHWKDSAIMLKGEAVWSLTTLFLSMWEFHTRIDENYLSYKPQQDEHSYKGAGYVQPFSDSPLDNELLGETVYTNLINKAVEYVYITSPYLIIGYEMVQTLCSTAKSGVDVRIMTPFIGDKWYVHEMTRSYYQILLEAGVRIFEYTPGFIHAKSFVCDDQYAIIGTINVDFRSFNLNFECGVWIYNSPVVNNIKADFLTTQTSCTEITLQTHNLTPWYLKIRNTILRIFSPLM